MGSAIRAEGLVKSFGAVRALGGVDLEVARGQVLGLLGPNGAGKTTVVRILTTLLRPDAGRAEVAGYDVVRQPDHVRASIGLTGQYAAVDENLTGRENLEMIGRLSRLSKKAASSRAEELLARFELVDAADRPARTYSGGMRRRLDLAASLVGRPAVLFLDEPTTGLDPRSRQGLWDVIRQLVSDGTTLLLTTQYLEEADHLADQIAVIDGGEVIARGTADALKAMVGGAVLELRPAQRDDLGRAGALLDGLAVGEVHSDPAANRINLPIGDDTALLAHAVRRLDDAGIAVADLGVRRPSLDEVFLTLTGHQADVAAGPEPAGRGRRRERSRA